MSDMRFRRLGRSGLVVSVIGLGCNNFGRRIDEAATRKVVDAALEAGITFFDTADNYGESETYLGAALKGRREDVVIATKFGLDLEGRLGRDFDSRTSRRYLRRAIESSLRRLQTDWIDLYQLHRPDPLTPIEETLESMNDLVREGKVRYLGSSNLSAWQIADAEWCARTHQLERFVSAENRYNLIDRTVESEIIPACAHFGIGMVPYSPLENGLLTGKYHRGEPLPEGARLASRPEQVTERRITAVERLEAFAHERGVGLLDVAIGGLAAKPEVASVIAGATRPEQVFANVAAGSWLPSEEDLIAIDERTLEATN